MITQESSSRICRNGRWQQQWKGQKQWWSSFCLLELCCAWYCSQEWFSQIQFSVFIQIQSGNLCNAYVKVEKVRRRSNIHFRFSKCRWKQGEPLLYCRLYVTSTLITVHVLCKAFFAAHWKLGAPISYMYYSVALKKINHKGPFATFFH